MEEKHNAQLTSAVVATSVLHVGTAQSQKRINNSPTRQTCQSWLHQGSDQDGTVEKVRSTVYG